VRFSLRGLLVMVLAIGTVLGWVVRSARIQRDAVAAIERAGGHVEYDYEYPHGIGTRNGEPWAPKWLVNLIGLDYFAHVAWVDLSGTRPDAVMPYVGQLNRIESLILPHSYGVRSDADRQWLGLGYGITDAGLLHVAALTRLRSLDLSTDDVTDAGLAHLKGLTELQVLFLFDTQVTDAGLAHLKGLSSLRVLLLGDTDVTDAGLAHLERLASLETLQLDRTKVDDAGLTHLKGLSNLDELNLDRTQVTDAGLTHLKDLSNLHKLGLDRTRVTDAGLTHLRGLSSLRILDLLGTKVTEAGVRELKQSLPKTTICH